MVYTTNVTDSHVHSLLPEKSLEAKIDGGSHKVYFMVNHLSQNNNDATGWSEIFTWRL